jgi:hypothetical protein
MCARHCRSFTLDPDPARARQRPRRSNTVATSPTTSPAPSSNFPARLRRRRQRGPRHRRGRRVLDRERPELEIERILTTVLFTDIAGSTNRRRPWATGVGARLDTHTKPFVTNCAGFGERRSTRPATASWPASTVRASDPLHRGNRTAVGTLGSNCEQGCTRASARSGHDLAGLSVHIAAVGAPPLPARSWSGDRQGPRGRVRYPVHAGQHELRGARELAAVRSQYLRPRPVEAPRARRVGASRHPVRAWNRARCTSVMPSTMTWRGCGISTTR